MFIRKNNIKIKICANIFFGSSRAPTPTIFTHNSIFDAQILGLKGSSLTEELAPKATEEVNVCRVFLYKTGKLGGSLHLIRHSVTPSPSRRRLVKPTIYRSKRLLLDGGAGAEGD